MPPQQNQSQREQALALLKSKVLVRAADFAQAGIRSETLSRLEREGLVLRLARGLYQLPDGPVDEHHAMAQTAKLVPRGVICLNSALAFHGLTDHIPAKVWLAIGLKDWRPTFSYSPARFVRFNETNLSTGVKHHLVDGVKVPIFDITKTLVDLFRYRRTVGLNIALEGLRETLRQRKATPAHIANAAVEAGMWKVIEPYMTAMTSDA